MSAFPFFFFFLEMPNDKWQEHVSSVHSSNLRLKIKKNVQSRMKGNIVCAQ